MPRFFRNDAAVLGSLLLFVVVAFCGGALWLANDNPSHSKDCNSSWTKADRYFATMTALDNVSFEDYTQHNEHNFNAWIPVARKLHATMASRPGCFSQLGLRSAQTAGHYNLPSGGPQILGSVIACVVKTQTYRCERGDFFVPINGGRVVATSPQTKVINRAPQYRFNPVPSPTVAYAPPAGPTAVCRDGTYSYSATRSGTCSWHGGVAQWLG